MDTAARVLRSRPRLLCFAYEHSGGRLLLIEFVGLMSTTRTERGACDVRAGCLVSVDRPRVTIGRVDFITAGGKNVSSPSPSSLSLSELKLAGSGFRDRQNGFSHPLSPPSSIDDDEAQRGPRTRYTILYYNIRENRRIDIIIYYDNWPCTVPDHRNLPSWEKPSSRRRRPAPVRAPSSRSRHSPGPLTLIVLEPSLPATATCRVMAGKYIYINYYVGVRENVSYMSCIMYICNWEKNQPIYYKSV